MQWLRSRSLRVILAFIVLILLLFVADTLCYQVALPVEIDIQHDQAVLHVGSETLQFNLTGTPTALQFAPHDPVVHEYQIDGSDSTNNFTLDPNYLHSIKSSPYYQFQAWMRDLNGTSRWRNLSVWENNHLIEQTAWPINGSSVALPAAVRLRVSLQLQRPETPMVLNLVTSNGTVFHITLDRNDRFISVTKDVPGQAGSIAVTSTFFPVDVAPFAAMVLDTIIRIMLWSIVILLIVVPGEVAITFVRARWEDWWRNRYSIEATLDGKSDRRSTEENAGDASVPSPHPHPLPPLRAFRAWWGRPLIANTDGRTQLIAPLHWHSQTSAAYLAWWRRLTRAVHPVGLVALVGSLMFVAWIALVQFNAEPHIYDSSAYLFAAKMYSEGHLWVPVPKLADMFPGPFMVQFDGRWFAQYAPGTALMLVPGIWLGVPWLVEPLLGTLALLGIGMIAARLYDRKVATLAIILGAFSPFYSYVSASYLSHTVALFFFVWGLWALVKFAQGEAGWNLLLSAALFGMAGLTRDLVAVLFVAIVVPGIVLVSWLSWRKLRGNWRRWIRPGIGFLIVLLIFVGITLGYNALLTGNALISPRSLFFPGDQWGFGTGVGFYGQHTLAAGLVNLDELLTILQIDLYGWPFYLTLAFLALPILTRRAKGVDWFMLAGAAIIPLAYVGYFYHGIYLGPRYLFEALPFLLILTARGILVLAETGLDVSRVVGKWLYTYAGTRRIPAPLPASFVTIALVVALFSCNVLYYMSRQIVRYSDFSGLPYGYHIDLAEIYHPPVHHAIVVYDNQTIYQFVLFPLNDPLLQGDVIYAYADSAQQYAELHTVYPGRTLYQLEIAPDGSVRYVRLQPL